MDNVGWGETAPQTETAEARKARLVGEWLASIQPKKDWTSYEAAKRAEVVSEFFATPIVGTNRQPLAPYNMQGSLKLVHKLTYSLGDKDLVDPALGEKVSIETQVDALLDAITALGQEGPLLAERLVKWKPELNEPEYKTLSKRINDNLASAIEIEAKRMLDSILTVKPASPQLEFEPPKVQA